MSCLSNLCQQRERVHVGLVVADPVRLDSCAVRPDRPPLHRHAPSRLRSGPHRREVILDRHPVAGALALVLELHDRGQARDADPRTCSRSSGRSRTVYWPPNFIAHSLTTSTAVLYSGEPASAAPGYSACIGEVVRPVEQRRQGRPAHCTVCSGRGRTVSVVRVVRAHAVAAAVHVGVNLVGRRRYRPPISNFRSPL